MRGSTTPEAVVLVFARAPVAGRVKTRLAAQLGAWRAARLHRRLMAHALATARNAGCGPVELYLDARHSLLPTARVQRGEDLGMRMYHALGAALRRHERAILIGSDCPALTPGDLRRAARLLAGGYDVVLSPAEDGGYGLIGVRRLAVDLFSGIDWGTSDVYSETVRRVEAAKLRWQALRSVWDVDRPGDVARLRTLRLNAERASAYHARNGGAR